MGQLGFEALAGSYPNDALYRDAGSHAGIFGHLRDVAFGRPRAKPAFVFLVVPLASWLLIAIVIPIAARMSGRLSRRGDGG